MKKKNVFSYSFSLSLFRWLCVCYVAPLLPPKKKENNENTNKNTARCGLFNLEEQRGRKLRDAHAHAQAPLHPTPHWMRSSLFFCPSRRAVVASAAAMRSRWCAPPRTSAFAALCCTTRDVSDSAGRKAHTTTTTTTAAELRAALRTLHLNDDCTDAEVKRAFQAFAMQHHPDMKAAVATSSTSSSAASPGSSVERDGAMHRGTEAYHLLRTVAFEARRRILRNQQQDGGGGGGAAGRFRGPHADFHYSEEEYAKAQRVYEGDRRRRRRPSQQQQQRRGNGQDDANEADAAFFDLNTEEGRRRAARLEEVTARIAEMRRRGRRDDLPPWRVYDDGRVDSAKESGRSSTAAFNSAAGASASTSSSSSASSHSSSTAGSGPRNPHRLGLHFLQSTAASLRNVRDLYRSRPGFAGMDGSSFDNPGSAARVAPELSANPHLRQYILMKHRAQEKAIIDRAVRRPLMLLLLLVSVAVGVLMGLKVVSLNGARRRQDEELRKREEERGGG